MSISAPRCSCIVCHEEKSSKGIHSHYLTAPTKEGKQRAIDNGKKNNLRLIEYHQQKHQSQLLDYNLGANGQRQGKNYYVLNSFGITQRLESSYEFKTYEILESMMIKWERPKFTNYIINGKSKRYFPDFYLPEYDIYLDPKNDYLIEKDKEKIECVIHQSKINLHILSYEMITKEYIQKLVDLSGYAPDPSEFQSDASTRLA